MKENKMNKYAKESKVVEKQTIQFPWKWTGNRIPEFVIFPSGKKTKVSYMRDGIILFESGESGEYARTWDNNKTKERAIIISLEIDNG